MSSRGIRWLVGLGLALVLVVGLARLRFDTEILNLLPDHLAVADGLKTYQRHFTDARELILTVEAGDAGKATEAARALAEALRRRTDLVADVFWQAPWLEQPRDALELVAHVWLNQSPEHLSNLVQRLSSTNLSAVVAESRDRLATSLSPGELARVGRDPLGFLDVPESAGAGGSMMMEEGGFASADGRMRLVYVQAAPLLAGYRECLAWMGEIRRVIAEAVAAQNAGGAGGIEVHYTGRPVFVTEIAGGMERDMTGSTAGTLGTIAVLFWLTHRRVRPLVWLLVTLLLVQAVTLAVAGLLFGRLNVVSLGFAAILLGLAEDFGIVIYQESLSHPEAGARELRRSVGPGIFWSAVTTAGAFGVLNWSELPGLRWLGSLVAVGIVVAAILMVGLYLPWVLRGRERGAVGVPTPEAPTAGAKRRFLLFEPLVALPVWASWMLTLGLGVAAVVAVTLGGLRFDRSPNVLAPKRSEAKETLDRVKREFGRGREPVWVLVEGHDEAEVGRRLAAVEPVLRGARERGEIEGYTLPTALWPAPDYQRVNVGVAAGLATRGDEFRGAILSGGFTTNALPVTDAVLGVWREVAGGEGVRWPTNRASRWILGKVSARSSEGFVALGLVRPTAVVSPDAAWMRALAAEGVTVSGWELLGTTVFDLAMRDLPPVLGLVLGIVVVSLWLAFRDVRQVGLSLAALAFGGLLLQGAMVVLGWDWNLMNLMAVPLILGMGVDFGIHMQLALRRHEGDREAVRGSLGRALLLAGSTTVAGFASLGFSSNAGLASLGKVCGLGVLLALLVAVYLLPVWWSAGQGQRPEKAKAPLH